MSGTVLFKFKNARGDPEAVQFDGYHISAVELKNLIAEKKGLVDGTLELSDPKTKAVFEDSHVFPRGSAVTVRRVAATRAAQRAQQQAVTAADAADEGIAGPAMATLQAMTAQSGAAAVDPQDENATLQQRKAGQGAEDLQIAALVDAQNEAWRAQTDKNILATRAREQQLAAQRGRGRGFGSSFMHSGRGRGQGAAGIGFCKFCGKLDDHFSDDCPQKYNPRTDLRHVRAPAGIPAELLETSNEGGLLLNTGKTGALKSSTAAAAKEFAALPTAVRRAPAALTLTNAPHEEQQQQQLLENGGTPAAAGGDGKLHLGMGMELEEPAAAGDDEQPGQQLSPQERPKQQQASQLPAGSRRQGERRSHRSRSRSHERLKGRSRGSYRDAKDAKAAGQQERSSRHSRRRSASPEANGAATAAGAPEAPQGIDSSWMGQAGQLTGHEMQALAAGHVAAAAAAISAWHARQLYTSTWLARLHMLLAVLGDAGNAAADERGMGWQRRSYSRSRSRSRSRTRTRSRSRSRSRSRDGRGKGRSSKHKKERKAKKRHRSDKHRSSRDGEAGRGRASPVLQRPWGHTPSQATTYAGGSPSVVYLVTFGAPMAVLPGNVMLVVLAQLRMLAALPAAYGVHWRAMRACVH
ncbi:hypothetical protein COO60DRAFT_1459237 [Scenedesmus sp. NREL 46B-D3]|nr:hypothetical protein COO60DRAFT_1459237 [Scenedesmus sp. NREL 46B-D3]